VLAGKSAYQRQSGELAWYWWPTAGVWRASSFSWSHWTDKTDGRWKHWNWIQRWAARRSTAEC